MKKILFSLAILSAATCVAHASTSWKPAVGDKAVYNFYEEQPNDDGVFTGTLEKKVIAVSSYDITVQYTLTKQDYDDHPAVTTTKTYKELLEDVQGAAIEMQDCAMDVGGDMLPISVVTPMGTISSCLTSDMLGKDLDGDPAVIHDMIADVPFGFVRMDSTKTSNGNHIRVTLQSYTLGSQRP